MLSRRMKMMEKYKIVVGHITFAMLKQTPMRDHVHVKICNGKSNCPVQHGTTVGLILI